jgi:SPP1 gp7 family putative phage head morphogenesis protein
VLRAQLRQILPKGTTPATAHEAPARLAAGRRGLHDALYAMLLEGARLGAGYGRGQVEALLGVATKADGDPPSLAIQLIDWDLVNEDARAWASQYAGTLVDGLTQTSLTVLQGGLADFIEGKLTYRDLIAHLAPTFGSQRANTVAVTEITRAFSAGSRAAWQRTGVVQFFTWETTNDERTCPYCQPRQGVVYPLNAEMPPAHVRCRCWTAPSVDGPAHD